MRLFLLIIALVIGGCSKGQMWPSGWRAGSPAARQNLIFYASFNSIPDPNPGVDPGNRIPVDLGDSILNQQTCCNESLIDTASGSYSGKALRFSVRNTDPNVSSKKRAEVTLKNDPPGVIVRRIGMRFKLEDSVNSVPRFDVTLSSNSVSAITITSGGFGMTDGTYNLQILDDGSGFSVQATATVTVSGGIAVSTNVTNGGSGYLGKPKIFSHIPGAKAGMSEDEQPIITPIQWHHDSTNGSPPLGFYLRKKHLELLRTTSAAIDGGWETEPGNPSNYVWLRVGGNPVEPVLGQWHDLVVEVKFSDTDTGPDAGWITVWYDGAKAYERTNVITNYSQVGSMGGNYIKLGEYTWRFHQTSCNCPQKIVYIDEVRIGDENSTYADVAP